MIAQKTQPKQHTKSELLKAVSEKTKMPQNTVNQALNGILDHIEDILSKGESITFLGFGKFHVLERKARDGRNPRTGEKMKLPASKLAKFTVGKILKNKVNQNKY